MGITAQMVKTLREKTGSGIMDCKSALAESNGDIDKSIEFLRKKGLAAAKKLESRATKEGVIGSYIHAGGKIGVLVEVNCETDFVAKTDVFMNLVKDIAMQVAASSPQYVRKEDVPEDLKNRELEFYKTEAKESKKPDNIVEKIAMGKLEKYLDGICLLSQPFIREPKSTVMDQMKAAVAKVGENITVKRFTRYRLGEDSEQD